MRTGAADVVIAAIMMHRQRVLVRAFERAGATSAAQARTAEVLGVKTGMAWHHLVGHAVLRCPGEGRYFLDEANWLRLRRRRRVIALAIICGLLLLLALVLLTVRAG
jgi:hypothetical protein